MQGGIRPRPYLRAGERRAQLLDAAAAVVGRDGLGSLTMASVAAEAGVSRQWLYEHFTDLDDLCRALLLDRFATLDARLDAARERGGPLDRALFAARLVFELEPADRRILWALVDGSGWNGPELAGIQNDLQERIMGRWTAVVRATGFDEVEARAVVWAVTHTVFALADKIERESLAVGSAEDLIRTMVTALTARPVPAHGRRRRPTRPERRGTSPAR
ncbi:MAG TPA: TetR/AcrR family transcriptional regulator [Acidimicrobiales bacterium]|nr:TetR/AcrR family transcriptional regulator [Acidimicrobiales bacterium]